jgi:signal transduction histidine kinase
MRYVVASGLKWSLGTLLLLGLCGGTALAEGEGEPPPLGLLTNLFQLREQAVHGRQVVHPFRIVAEVIDADCTTGVLLLRDASGWEIVRGCSGVRDIEAGATVCLEGAGNTVKRESPGLFVYPGMIVDNDGVHPSAVQSGQALLPAGTNQFSVQWFNGPAAVELKLEYEGPGIPRQPVPSSVLWRTNMDRATGRVYLSPGLDYRCYEGMEWRVLPDFQKSHPTKTGVVTNLDLSVRTRNDNVGLEFSGLITIPREGVYTFHLTSDDGGRLFVGGATMKVRVLGKGPAPVAAEQLPAALLERRNSPWVTLEGTVRSVGVWTSGGELQMRVGNEDIRVDVVESGDFVPRIPPHSKVRVGGIYQDVVSDDGARVPGRILVLNWNAVRPVELAEAPPAQATGAGARTNQPDAGRVPVANAAAPISTAAEIKGLSADLAKQELPVSIRGVAVSGYISKYSGAVVQDSTRGVFVALNDLPETEPLQRGEFCQIEGVTGPGAFAPVVVARRITHLGPGQLPKPVRATWDQLVNGSLDSEYAEIDGVVTAVRDRRVVLLTQGGKVALELNDFRADLLPGYEGAVVRIRGCVFADFNPETRKLGVGSLFVSGAAIDVLERSPEDLFSASQKSIGELLFYDPKPAPFRLLRVSGQIIYGRPGEYFLTDGTNGMHVTTRNSDSFAVGELVDAVGFLELGGAVIELKEAVLRRAGSAPLRVPTKLAPDRLLLASHAGTLVQVEAMLMNQWREGAEHVLELQSGFLAFKARMNSGQGVSLPPPGSRVELTGAYAPQGNRAGDGTVSRFEILLHEPTGLRVLATPPWWTLRRLLALAGTLALLLSVVLVWNKALRRQVQERTRKWETEIRNRQQAELQQAAEAERARIARDLHDELGTSLTEVSLLASAGLGQFQDGEKIRERFHAIAEKARDLVSGLDVIVWAIDPKRNSLQCFTDYLAVYANELFTHSSIVCRLRIRIECGAIALTEAVRHSLFLAVKEALNNVIRHAAATEVELRISQLGDQLQIMIADNGRGFDGNTIRRGNGLTNFQERLAAMLGECRVESPPGSGTTVTFIVPLAPAGGAAART